MPAHPDPVSAAEIVAAATAFWMTLSCRWEVRTLCAAGDPFIGPEVLKFVGPTDRATKRADERTGKLRYEVTDERTNNVVGNRTDRREDRRAVSDKTTPGDDGVSAMVKCPVRSGRVMHVNRQHGTHLDQSW